MNPILVSRSITALWSAAIVALAAVLGVETHWGKQLHSEIPEAQLPSAKNVASAVVPAFAMPPLELAYTEITNRPLFVPTRLPAPPATASVAQAMRRGQFQLAGTVVNGDLSVAYLKELNSGKTLRINRGAEVNGIVLDIVEPTRIVLKQGDETEELQLKTGASPRVLATLPGTLQQAPAPPQLAGAPVALAAPPLSQLGDTAGPRPGIVPNPVAPAGPVPQTAAPFQLDGPGFRAGPLPPDLADTSPQAVVPGRNTNVIRRGRTSTP